MPALKRIVLDILKPHHPNVLDFALHLAELDASYEIRITVEEVDERTESISMVIEGADIDFAALAARIADNGASVHSIDAVSVSGADASHGEAD